VLNPATTGTGQIGALDTTLLANGAYWVQLVATDTSGNSQSNLALVNVVGEYKPGRVTAKVTDLVVPATGLAIKIERSYDSLNKDRVSDFGYGWSLGTRVDLDVGPKGDVTFTLGGRRRTFYFTPNYVFPPSLAVIPLFLPAYTAEPGLPGSLKGSGPGCTIGGYDFWDVLLPVGNLYVCDTTGVSYDPPGYIYTDQFGTQYTLAADGSLQSVIDLRGNALTVTAAGITSSTGLSVPFVRDTQGRITKITDPLNHDYLYTYDADGNLATVVYPGDPAPTTHYTYYSAPAHLYQGGADPRGKPLPTAVYDTDGRLQTVTDAKNQTTSYTWGFSS
jgi:YD repeat-containing protein